MQDTWSILLPIIITHIVALVVIIILIKRLLLSDTMTAVRRVRQVEAEVRKKEEAIRLEIEEHEKEAMRKKAESEEEIEKQREESRKQVEKLREQIVADARNEANQIVEQARKNEKKLRDQIAQDMEEKAVEYGAEVFKLVFSNKIKDQLNDQFVAELLDALGELDSASITVDSSNSEFIASHPLSAEQKQRLRQLLSDKFSVDIEINEKVQEDLLAGLILKLGSLEIDGSLLNRYREAAEEVKKGIGAP